MFLVKTSRLVIVALWWLYSDHHVGFGMDENPLALRKRSGFASWLVYIYSSSSLFSLANLEQAKGTLESGIWYFKAINDFGRSITRKFPIMWGQVKGDNDQADTVQEEQPCCAAFLNGNAA